MLCAAFFLFHFWKFYTILMSGFASIDFRGISAVFLNVNAIAIIVMIHLNLGSNSYNMRSIMEKKINQNG